MSKVWAVVFTGSLCALVTCGGKVVLELDKGGGGAGGTGGSGSGAAKCPNAPFDPDVIALEGKPCDTDADVCSSNNGCGGCSVTCQDGVWTSTDAMICFAIGSTC